MADDAPRPDPCANPPAGLPDAFAARARAVWPDLAREERAAARHLAAELADVQRRLWVALNINELRAAQARGEAR